MRPFRDCLSCCLTVILLGLLLLAIAVYLGMPVLMDAIQHLAGTR